ncbi:MAG: radical SAM family heme chaperone HemW [Undibacterium sp.]|nr:radical SAM family heme chaperone HemW [Opitutaceae bacterium]
MSGSDTAQAKGVGETPLGLYVHVPFCASTCDFCAFYQTQPTAETVAGFLDGVKTEAELVVWPRPVTTVFWGGGTPGLLAPRQIEQLGAGLRDRFGGEPQEWTVELAPASVTGERLAAFKAIGVTRISLGVQSFSPELLDGLGRQHTREQIYRAHERIRAAEFRSVNLDLMFALPGQDEASWVADIQAAVALAPDHLSTYCLTFEEDTALWVKLSQGKVKLDVEREARLYEETWARLADLGYGQYEVSNFARPGHVCRHNLNTWHMHEWIGLGPSAASQHAGWRGANVSDLAKWREQVARGERVTEDRVALTPALLAEDALVFGMRMNAGVDLAPWRERCPDAPWAAVETLAERLVAEEFAVCEGTRLRLTNRGRLLADNIGAEMMAAFEAEAISA